MDTNWMNRRLVLTSLCAIAFAAAGFAQHTDGADTITHGSNKGKGRGVGGAQHGRPEDPHGGEDDHGDDHGDADDHGDGDDHASGGKGKGPKYKGGRNDDDGDADNHGDDHGDDHTSHEGGDTDHASGGDDHGDDSDHASGGKGKGPKYRGGREGVGVSHGRSLEDRVLKTPSF